MIMILSLSPPTWEEEGLRCADFKRNILGWTEVDYCSVTVSVLNHMALPAESNIRAPHGPPILLVFAGLALLYLTPLSTILRITGPMAQTYLLLTLVLPVLKHLHSALFYFFNLFFRHFTLMLISRILSVNKTGIFT